MNSNDFSLRTRTLRATIESALAGFIPGDDGPSEDGVPEVLRRAMRHSLLAPGKRLRPMLVWMAVEACGADPHEALGAACAVEMIHTYSLIHDDLPAMDDDDMRRGIPSCHAQFGEAIAILTGDALLALAFQVLAETVQPPEVAARCSGVLARAAGAGALVGGQVDDLAAQFQQGDLQQLQAIHRRKTGALFNASLGLGGLVAQADPERLAALETYGDRLGLAFQITDDILDLRGDEAIMGKRLGKDQLQGKLTFPALLGVQQSQQRAETLIEQACQALRIFQTEATSLESLARYVLQRTR